MTTRIIGTGSYVPDFRVPNDDLAKIVETNDEWIRERTGIACRHIDAGEGVVSMGVKAARQALSNAGVSAEDIDLIIVATSTPDNIFPNTACSIQTELGNSTACCFDLNAACSGFIYGLNTAHAYISTGLVKKALIIGSEVLSKTIDWTDRGTCILFGDGAGAAVVGIDEEGVIAIDIGSDGGRGGAITCDARALANHWGEVEVKSPYMYMNGQEVFKFAVRKIPETVNAVLKNAEMTIEDVDLFILHQANQRIIEAASKRLGVSMEKFPLNMMEYGNTSAASIPLLLDELNRDGKLKRGQKIILSGFGAGLTWGATLLTW